MIGCLFRCRLRMAANRVARSFAAERAAAAAVALTLAGFAALTLWVLFADPAFLLASLRELGIARLNRVTLGLVQMVFLVVLAVCLAEELAALNRTPEIEFLLHFGHASWRYAAFRLVLISLRLLFASVLIAPLAVVYVFYIHAGGGWGAVGLAVPLFAAIAAGGAASLAALVLAVSAVAGWLLGRFRAGSLVAAGVAALAVIVGPVDASGSTLAWLADAGGRIGQSLPFVPLAHLLATLEAFDGAGPGTVAVHLAAGLAGVAVASGAGIGLMSALVLSDIAARRENAQRLQSGSVSRKAGWPLAWLPAPVRALWHEELLFLARRLVLPAVFFGIPIVAIPFYLPRAALEVLGRPVVLIAAAHVAVAFVSFSDLAASDLSQKAGFEALVRSLPVPLERVLWIKAALRVLLFTAVALACLAGWAWTLAPDPAELAALAASSVAFALAFVSLVSGVAYAGTALSCRVASPGIPGLAGLAATGAGILLVAAVLAPLAAGRSGLAAAVAWGAVPPGLAALSTGGAWLARRSAD